MPFTSLKQNTSCVVLLVASIGCGKVSAPTSQEASTTEAAALRDSESEKGRPPTYVHCRATFTALENDHLWFDNSTAGHDDGRAALASFVLVEPATYKDRSVGILFKYAEDSNAIAPLDQQAIGSQFAFQLPPDFLTGDHDTIDNIDVSGLHKIQP